MREFFKYRSGCCISTSLLCVCTGHFKEDAGSGELRISELNFTAGFAGPHAPVERVAQLNANWEQQGRV